MTKLLSNFKILFEISILSLFLIGCSSDKEIVLPTKHYNISNNNIDIQYIDYKLKQDLAYNKNVILKQKLYIPKEEKIIDKNNNIFYKKEYSNDIDLYKNKKVIKDFKNKAQPVFSPLYNVQIGINNNYKTFTFFNDKSYLINYTNKLNIKPLVKVNDYQNRKENIKGFYCIIRKHNNKIYLYYKNKKIELKNQIKFNIENIEINIIQNNF